MPNIFVNGGQSVNATQNPLATFSVFVAQGGTIGVLGSADAIILESGNAVIAGDVYASNGGDGIHIQGVSVANVMIAATGHVAGYFGSTAITTTPGSRLNLTNYGFIGANAGNKAIQTGTGVDTIYNYGTIAGDIALGSGDDGFYSRSGQVFGAIDAGAGNDILHIESALQGASAFSFDGGDGLDWLDMHLFRSAVWVDLDYDGVEVWTRNDQNLGSSNPWQALAHLAGVERVLGSDLSDYLSGNGADNTFAFSRGFDTIGGDGGTDTYDLQTAPFAVWIDLATSGMEAWTRDGPGLTTGTWRAFADLTSIETIISTPFNDQIYGDANSNTFFFLGTAGPNQNDIFDGRGGTDTLDFSFYGFGVWVGLSFGGPEVWTKGTTSVNVPAGTFGSVADIAGFENLVGSAWGDYLAGDGLANRIESKGNPDELWGMGGADTFIYNLSAGNVQGSSQRDTIKDYALGVDKIGIAGLVALPTIVINGVPASADDTLLYNTTTGVLSYDADGTGGGAAVEIAFLTGAPALTSGDFIRV